MRLFQFTKTLAINLDHVIALDYRPALRPGIDDDPSDSTPSRLSVTTTEMASAEYGSYTYEITGEDADAAWDTLVDEEYRKQRIARSKSWRQEEAVAK